MNNYFFDRANAVDRENRIREEAQANHQVFELTHEEKPSTTSVLHPRYRRSILISLVIILMGILLMIIVAAPAQAQTIEPSNTPSDGGSSRAMYIFTMGNIAYVRGNYAEAVELFQESIDILPQELFELDPNFAHMYFYLGRAQYRLGELDDAMISLHLYIEYIGEEIDPRIIQWVEAIES